MTVVERIHLAERLAPIEAVLLDRVEYGWEDDFYEQVIDPMTPWLPDGDEAGETPLSQFLEKVRARAKQAALEAVVSEVCEALQDAPPELLETLDLGRAPAQFRADVALANQSEDAR